MVPPVAKQGITRDERTRLAELLAGLSLVTDLARGHSPEEAARIMQKEPLDPHAVGAVLEAAGHATRVRASWPAGLTDREVEVLRVLARGASKREIARALFTSPSTAHTHVVHIYEKLGVSTRAAAALFAMEHGLLHD